MKFDVEFDLEQFRRDIGSDPAPRKAFPVSFDDPSANQKILEEHLKSLAKTVVKPPVGALHHPYLVPGAIYDQLWDWDAYFMGFALMDDYIEHYKGCILNFLERIKEDGQPAKLIRPDGSVNYDDIPYPIQAQWCVAVSQKLGDVGWMREHWESLIRCRGWYEKTSQRRRGLFRQPVSRGAGLDNDPVIYGRRADTVALVDMNCFHYREYLAMCYLARQLGDEAAATTYASQAADLRHAINKYMWDPIDGMFYHLDLSDHVDITRQGVSWELPYKVRGAATLFALWSGVADADKARRVIEEHVLNPAEFLSDYGIRSLAKNERTYNNAAMGDPSNWQGPVWGLVTALVAYGLSHYGYKDQAADVANRLVSLFAGDLRQNGTLHEYYHAETGAPIFNPGFLSWNLMAIRLRNDLASGIEPHAIGE